MRIATDVGGTFTDLVYFDPNSGVMGVCKTDTTPPDFERGVLNAVAKAGVAPADITFFAHGTTVVINALTERKGAKTGLVTTAGFRDVLEIGRGTRPDLYNFYFKKPPPFVPRYLRREVRERLSYRGEILTPIELDDLASIVADFQSEGVESIAVCLLHAYANPIHETAIVARIKALWPSVAVIASHEITREWREYERTSTTVLSAYVKPIAARYLAQLQSRLDAERFKGQVFVMQSNGGIATVERMKANPISMVESGPVSGMLGAIALGKLIGEPNIIALDIGGTTAKCTLIKDHEAPITTEYKIEWTRSSPGYPIKTPVVDIVEIGNGGGSIAWLDAAQSLHVGPQSAGANPGPVAYGRGGLAPTTTDANLMLRRINPDYFVGGEIVPDLEAVNAAFKRLAESLNIAAMDVARGVVRIANANMVNALNLVSVNRGHDPRDFSMVAFGGGGAMHAAALARELGVPKVIIPNHAAVFSAWGMLLTDLRRDYLLTRVIRLEAKNLHDINDIYEAQSKTAEADFAADGHGRDQIVFQRFADMRYRGQEHTVKVAFPAQRLEADAIEALVKAFDASHEREFRFRLEAPTELVNIHLVAYGLVDKPAIPKIPRTTTDATLALKGGRAVDFDTDGILDADIYDRPLLAPGMSFKGPAIIEEAATVTVVLPGQSVDVDDYGNLHIINPAD
jgi:N-methylhydantoinase A